MQLTLEELEYWALADLFVLGLVSQHTATRKTAIIWRSFKANTSLYSEKGHYYQQQPLCILAQKKVLANFDVLLTVHLSIYILVISQLDAQNLFYNKLISCLYMFRAPSTMCSSSGGQNCIMQPLVSSHL